MASSEVLYVTYTVFIFAEPEVGNQAKKDV